jgi:putative ATP-dependent DNA ligase
MDRDLADALGVDVEEGDLREHFQQERYRGREYQYLPDKRHGVERGTVLVDDVVVRGFPSIPRVLVLESGIPEAFDGSVAIEEKLNGYNVRVARVEGDVLAFTRSGYVCPYTTAFARDLPVGSFFEEFPEHVLCGELIGPENPYTTHDYEEVDGAALRVFDVRHRESGESLAVEERYECCDRHDLPGVPRFGIYETGKAVDRAREIIADLDERGREGIVLKSLDGREAVKYTTSANHRADLAHAFDKPFDYGRDFLFARVIREAFQAVEFEDSEAEARERARDLGEAILLPAVESIRAVDRGEQIGDEHTVRGDSWTVESLLAQLESMGLHLEIREDRENDERMVRFLKVADASRDKIEHYLAGGQIDE